MKDRAAAHLRGTLHLIEQHKDRPTAEALRQIRQTVVSAIDVLSEHDPVQRKVNLAALLIQESTTVHTIKRNGREIERVTITDQLIYSKAIRMIHELPRETARK